MHQQQQARAVEDLELQAQMLLLQHLLLAVMV
jgi:hypothetical protein